MRIFMRRSWCHVTSSCLFVLAATSPIAGAQTTVHSTATTGSYTNNVSDRQTDTVTATTDKQGKPLLSPRHQLEFVHAHNGQPTRIVISYGAPSVKGRKIYGEVVPYGQWWRAGANEATSFMTDHTVRIGDLTVPAGSYTL